ncbi:MAG: dTDP-4-dehydrorhamnose 3,5-epimerase [Silicimonas sp.]|nr:dTDP-4-dehydrorhamnose 3,5-epimerase [Silicimonas sp.]
MKVHTTSIPGVLIVEPKRHGDARGFFSETWNSRALRAEGIDIAFVQDNASLSADPGTLRGLHYQAPPHAQTKLVSCAQGGILDVVVDVRRGSPTFGQNFGVELSFENGLQLLVPKGCLHGFLTRVENTVVTYKVDDFYSAEADGAVHWASCGIDWGLDNTPVLSEKDEAAPALDAFDSPFVWEAA